MTCHSPHGECGLKWEYEDTGLTPEQSLPAWGVWIEIPAVAAPLSPAVAVTPRMGSVD